MDDFTEIEKRFRKELRSSALTKEKLERTIISLGLYRRISGIIGPYIIANRNGRMIIRLRPRNFQKSLTEASFLNRKNMAAANKFAMFLKSVDEIYELWKKPAPDRLNAFTRLIKVNKKHLVDDHPSLNNSITPEGFSIITDNLVSVKNHRILVNQNYIPAKNEKLIIIITAHTPLLKGFSEYECIKIDTSLVMTGEQITLTQHQREILRNYSKFILYYAIVRKEGTKILWSNTCAINADFDFGGDYELAEAAGYGQILSGLLDLIPVTVLVKPPG